MDATSPRFVTRGFLFGYVIKCHTETEEKHLSYSGVSYWFDFVPISCILAFKRTRFPLPLADIEFYAQRLKNLEGIYSQLRDPRVKRMAHYLEDTRSVYLTCFKTMLTNVVGGKQSWIHSKIDFTCTRETYKAKTNCSKIIYHN